MVTFLRPYSYDFIYEIRESDVITNEFVVIESSNLGFKLTLEGFNLVGPYAQGNFWNSCQKSRTTLIKTFIGFIQSGQIGFKAKVIISGLKNREPYKVKFYQYNDRRHFNNVNGRLFSKDSIGQVISVKI